MTPGSWLPNGGRPASSAEPEAPELEAPEQGEHLSTDDQTDWLAAPHAAAESQTDALAGMPAEAGPEPADVGAPEAEPGPDHAGALAESTDRAIRWPAAPAPTADGAAGVASAAIGAERSDEDGVEPIADQAVRSAPAGEDPPAAAGADEGRVADDQEAGDGFAVRDDLADEWGDEAGPGAAAAGPGGPAQLSGTAGPDGAGSDGAAAAVAAGLLAAGDAAAVQRVAAAVGALDEMAGLPVGEHVRWYDALHGELSDALASIDEV
ncbi:MAG TPA: hypothetical protein VMU51_03025 [Mycobacteriales bacterium]|nr:hypothetical protein [Mycobacteriales bacterium]